LCAVRLGFEPVTGGSLHRTIGVICSEQWHEFAEFTWGAAA